MASTPGCLGALRTRFITKAAFFSKSAWPSMLGSMTMIKLPQFFAVSLFSIAAPTRGPAKSSTMSAKLLDL